MKKILRSALAVLMILALMSSYATVFVNAATATVTVLHSDVTFTKNMYAKRLSDGATAGHTVGQSVTVYRFGDQMAYCIEPGAYSYPGLKYNQDSIDDCDDDYWDYMQTILPEVADGIAVAAAIGDGLNPAKNMNIQAVAQVLIHEIACGYRDPITGEVSDTRFFDNITNAGGHKVYWVDRYNTFDKAFKNFKKIPSFMYKNKGDAATNPLVLEWNEANKRYEITITDTNGMLATIPNICQALGMTVSGERSGNTLTLWTTEPIEDTVTSTKILKDYDFATSETPSAIIWSNQTGYDVRLQAMISSSIPDPASAYIAVKTGTPPSITVSGQKTWIDADNQDGKRPDEITIRLFADGTEYASTTVTEADGWKYSFTDLPKFIDDQEVVWTITEDPVDGYETTYDGYNVINSHTPETTLVGDYKTWNDGGDRDGKRPDEITVHLLADGVEVASKTVTEADDWAYSFEGFPKYRDGGIEIEYTVSEDPVEGYETAYDGLNIINTYTPETIELSGEKIWVDDNNRDGKRPDMIIAVLYADGAAVEFRVADQSTNWQYRFTNLYKYRDGGIEIDYEIKENIVPEGYVASYEGNNIINTYVPEIVTVPVSKTWNDADNQDGIRPGVITVRLFANGSEYASKTITASDGWETTFTDLPKYQNGVEIVWTIQEDPVEGYETTYDGFNITNTHTPETTEFSGIKSWNDNNNQDGKRPESIVVWAYADGSPYACKTVTEADGWKYSFTNLPKFIDGTEIVWTVDEDAVEFYSKEINGFDITNSYTPEQTSVSGVKSWVDDNDRDGLRPDEITVNLLADGTVIDSVTTNEASAWRYEFTGLPIYKDGGTPIVYTVEESVVPEGYTVSYTGFNMTNTHTPELTEVGGVKSWVDDNDRDGLRPDEITVNLLADGTVIDTVTTNETDGWAYSFTDLLKYRDSGVEIVYTVEEAVVPKGYTVSYDGFNMTNTHAPELTEVGGVKSWVDDNDRDGLRPDEITVNLLADGTVIDTVTTTEADEWTYSFTDLLKYRDSGVEIVYTVEEAVVPEGYTVSYDGYNIINTHEIETITISGQKIWVDGNNAELIRPNQIKVAVYADGVEYQSATVTAISETAPNQWSFEFTNLPANRDNGTPIEYTIRELDVPAGYEATVEKTNDGFVLTNTHTPTPVYEDTPKTGENPIGTYTAMTILVITALGITVTGFVASKRKKKQVQ